MPADLHGVHCFHHVMKYTVNMAEREWEEREEEVRGNGTGSSRPDNKGPRMCRMYRMYHMYHIPYFSVKNIQQLCVY